MNDKMAQTATDQCQGPNTEICKRSSGLKAMLRRWRGPFPGPAPAARKQLCVTLWG